MKLGIQVLRGYLASTHQKSDESLERWLPVVPHKAVAEVSNIGKI
jgi:hypothetical protein